MRLVELLARELVEWPEGAGRASQDKDKEVRFDTIRDDFYAETLADDAGVDFGDGAIVTRQGWAAERARLEGAAEWNGEDLPPAGAVCEHQGDDEDCNSWFPVLILAHTKVDDRYVAVFQRTDDDIKISFSDAVFFRPIRTQEQIAAQEREEAINDLMQTTCIRRGEAERIYDAGYRKQEKGQ